MNTKPTVLRYLDNLKRDGGAGKIREDFFLFLVFVMKAMLIMAVIIFSCSFSETDCALAA